MSSLNGADLRGANLSKVKNIKFADLCRANLKDFFFNEFIKIDDTTRFDDK
jgi:uncharacterized protein YjbI with pentapeptide repeats